MKVPFELLSSFKGVGLILGAHLLAFLPELGSLTREQVAALVGVAPYNNQSGTADGSRSIYGGRKVVRDVLYMGTIVAIRSNFVIKTHYKKLRSRGKPHKVATVACMRKIMGTLNAILRDKTTWDELRFNTAKQDMPKK